VNETAARIIELATARGVSIAFAESLTGGLLTSALVDVPGASNVLRGGFVTYATPLKHSILGVPAERLAEHGPVDHAVAARMAHGARWVAAIDGEPAALGVATTGVAGPDRQDDKPVGLVYIGFARRDEDGGDVLGSVEDHFVGTRDEIRRSTVEAALRVVLGMLERPEQWT